MRYKYVYMVFPRAYSKSFLSVMVLMCRCILYPGCKLFITSGGKNRQQVLQKKKSRKFVMRFPHFRERLIGEEVRLRKEKIIVSISSKMDLILTTSRLENLLVVSVDMED